MDERWQARKDGPTLTGGDELQALLRRMPLQSKEFLEQIHPSLCPKETTKNNKRVDDSKGVWS